MIETWLTAGGVKLRLPILPEVIAYSGGNGIQKSTLHTLGEVAMAGKRTLVSMTLASYFPGTYDGNCQYITSPLPRACEAIINRWKDDGTPVRVIVVGGAMTFNRLMLIETASFTQGRKPEDLAYEIAFTEYVPILG